MEGQTPHGLLMVSITCMLLRVTLFLLDNGGILYIEQKPWNLARGVEFSHKPSEAPAVWGLCYPHLTIPFHQEHYSWERGYKTKDRLLNFRHRASLHDPRPTAKVQLSHSYYSQANRFPANATLQKSRSEAIGCLVQYCAGQNFNSRFASSEDHRPYGELLQTQTHIRHRYEYPSLPTLALGRAHLKDLVPVLITLETQSNHGGHLGRGHRRCLAPETNAHSRQSPPSTYYRLIHINYIKFLVVFDFILHTKNFRVPYYLPHRYFWLRITSCIFSAS